MQVAQIIYIASIFLSFGLNAIVYIPFRRYSYKLCLLIKNNYPNDFERLGKPWIQRDFQGGFISFLKLIYSNKQEFFQDNTLTDLIFKAKVYTTPWIISMALIFGLMIFGIFSGLLPQSFASILNLFVKSK